MQQTGAGTYGLPPAAFRARLDRAGLRAVSMIVRHKELASSMDRVIADAKALGVTWVGTANIPRDGELDAAEARKAAAVFNGFGAALARAGLRFFYHNHGFESVQHGDSTLFDLLVRETRPELVSFEMDVFWTVHSGQDPPALLKRYPDRFALMHVKDMKQGTPIGLLTGQEDVRNDVALGSGQIDLAAVLQTAQEAGVKHYFVARPTPISAAPGAAGTGTRFLPARRSPHLRLKEPRWGAEPRSRSPRGSSSLARDRRGADARGASAVSGREPLGEEGLDQAEHLAVHLETAGHQVAGLEPTAAAGEVAHRTAGLGDQQCPRREVPGREPELPEAVGELV